MQKNNLIGVCIITIVFLVLASLTNTIMYQTVESSNPQLIYAQYKENNQLEQKEVASYLNSPCDCEDEDKEFWHFPLLCAIIDVPVLIGIFLYDITGNLHLFFLLEMIKNMVSPFYQIAKLLNCSWLDTPDFEYLQKIIL